MSHASIIAVIALALLCAISPFRSALLVGAHKGPYSDYSAALNTFFGFAMIPFAMFTTGQKSDRPDKMFGELSYIVYLLHLPVLEFLGASQGSYKERAFSTFCAVVLTGAGSLLVWLVIDRPINDIRDRWVRARMRRAEAVVSSAISDGATP